MHDRSTSGRIGTVASPSSGPRWWRTRSPPSGRIRSASCAYSWDLLHHASSRHVQARGYCCWLGCHQLRNKLRRETPFVRFIARLHQNVRNSGFLPSLGSRPGLAGFLRLLHCPVSHACFVLPPHDRDDVDTDTPDTPAQAVLCWNASQDRQQGGAPGATASSAGGTPPQPRYQPQDQPQALHYRDGAPVPPGGGGAASAPQSGSGSVAAQPPRSKVRSRA